jgi:dihydrolipoamide dehydrogenase
VLSNIEILQLPAVPKTLVIVGAGAVGVEFASVFNSFGSQVTILEMLPRVTPIEDEEISAELEKALRKKGIQIFTEAKVESVTKDANGATVSFKDKTGKVQTLAAEKVLMAVGRVPKTENLGLEKSKAKLERGFIHVGPYMETAEPHLYAIGDIVAGMPQLAHAASMEGISCVAKITGKNMPPIDKMHIPNATYCEPQVASIGLTERAAREAGYAVKIGKFPFLGNSKATILGHHEGFIKVVSDEKYGEILGVHIIGPFATEIIAEAVAAMQLEATVDDLMSTVHAHPTVWEAMSDAVAAVRGLSINA